MTVGADSMVTVPRTSVHHQYAPALAPAATVAPGDRVRFVTWDARAGALLDRQPGSPFPLPPPIAGQGNPVTGPVRIIGAEPGDALVVEVLDIRCGPVGWCGAHAHVGPLPPGRITEPLGRTCRVGDGLVRFSETISLPLAPMVGCLGVAPEGEAVPTSDAGRHGGNLDQNIVTTGARVALPVAVPGALLALGDVHATQGDGELSGVALEIPGEVDVRVDVMPGTAPTWPWLIDDRRSSVMTVASDFVTARAEAVEAALVEVERCLGLAPADAMALLSLAADLRIGGAFGGAQVNVRLDLPIDLRVVPPALEGCQVR